MSEALAAGSGVLACNMTHVAITAQGSIGNYSQLVVLKVGESSNRLVLIEELDCLDREAYWPIDRYRFSHDE